MTPKILHLSADGDKEVVGQRERRLTFRGICGARMARVGDASASENLYVSAMMSR